MLNKIIGTTKKFSQIAPPLYWSEDAEFIAELEDRINKYNSGIEEAYTIDEAKLALSEMKAEYIK